MKISIPFNIFIILIILLPWHISGLYGFDWTDPAYNFQQALNILNNKKINQDFFTHIPGLSFFLEALLLKSFGITFENHRNFGLIFPITQYLCSVLFLSKILSDYKLKNYEFWSVILSSSILTSFWGIQLYWDVTNLAITFSFIIATLIFFLYENKNKFYFFLIIFFITLFISLQIFTKQSHGLINLFLTFFSIFIISILKRQSINFIIKIISLFFIFQLINIFLISNLTGIDLPISLSKSSASLELKGLSIERPFEIFLTVVGAYYSLKSIIFSMFFIFVGFFFKFFLHKNNLKKLFPICLLIFPLLSYYYSKIWMFSYFILVGFLFYQFYIFIKNTFSLKKFDNHKLKGNIILISIFPVIGSLLAEQLSWTGPYYIRPSIIMFIFLISLIIFYINDFKNLFFYKKFFISYLILIFIISIFFIEIRNAGEAYDHKRNGLVKIEKPESLRDWKVSKKTLEAINKLREASVSCKKNTLFQLTWMPISYEITSRINPTGYDLPYHDTITLTEAELILKNLISDPPGMLIVQPEYANYSGPFPAAGMKYLYNNLDDLLKYYSFNSLIEDNFNNFKVFCLDIN